MRKDRMNCWKDYILEFLMLFSAVTLGFIAENLREDYSDRQVEREYMRSYLGDLKNDTFNINRGLPLKEQRLKAIDSIFQFFKANEGVDRVPAYLISVMKRASWDRSYVQNTATMSQLKNSGGLRLIRKKIVADSIAMIDFRWERLEYYRERYIENQRDIYLLEEKIINAFDQLDSYISNETTDNGHNVPQNGYIRINKQYLNEYLNLLARQQTVTRQDRYNYTNLMRSSERLITLINKEYGF